MYQLLHRSSISWCDENCNVGNQPDSAWSHWRQKNCCSATLCPNADDNVHGTGFVLPTGHLLCPSCFTNWEAEILTKLNLTRSQQCAKDEKGTCSGCTLATAPSRTRLRHLMVRGHLRDLCYHFLNHLPPNTMNQVVCILQRELCDLHSTLDRKYLLGVPSRIYTSVLGWLAWNYSALLSQPITSMPPLDVGQSEPWAMVCYNHPPDTRTFRKRTDDETFSSMGADEGSWTELHPSHPANLGWDGRVTPIASSQSRLGWARYIPLVLFPATGPSHCAAPAYALHPAGRRQESLLLCGNLVFGPPYLTRRPCLFHARRTLSLAAVFPAHGASWAGLAFVRCETQTRPMRRTGERCRSEWRVLAPVIVGERPRASQEPPPDPLSPLRRPSWCEAAKRPTGADRGRISVAGRISAVSGASQRPPGFAGCS